jgi:predicted secreted protein
MDIDLLWAISIYLVIWWLVLFTILPLGVRSHHEEGVEVPGGGDPASPVNPNLKRKFFTTTWVSAIVLAVVLVVLHFGLIPIPDLPQGTITLR